MAGERLRAHPPADRRRGTAWCRGTGRSASCPTRVASGPRRSAGRDPPGRGPHRPASAASIASASVAGTNTLTSMSIVPRARCVHHASASAPPNACASPARSNASVDLDDLVGERESRHTHPLSRPSGRTRELLAVYVRKEFTEPREGERPCVAGGEHLRQRRARRPAPALARHARLDRRADPRLRRSTSAAKPAARSTRSSVSTLGVVRPDSYADSVECDVCARSAKLPQRQARARDRADHRSASMRQA